MLCRERAYGRIISLLNNGMMTTYTIFDDILCWNSDLKAMCINVPVKLFTDLITKSVNL